VPFFGVSRRLLDRVIKARQDTWDQAAQRD
jgi:hypothetical protein